MLREHIPNMLVLRIGSIASPGVLSGIYPTIHPLIQGSVRMATHPSICLSRILCQSALERKTSRPAFSHVQNHGARSNHIARDLFLLKIRRGVVIGLLQLGYGFINACLYLLPGCARGRTQLLQFLFSLILLYFQIGQGGLDFC